MWDEGRSSCRRLPRATVLYEVLHADGTREGEGMKPTHLEILQHALGASQYGQMPKYGADRNYYGTDAEDKDCFELVALSSRLRYSLPASTTALTSGNLHRRKFGRDSP